MNEQPNNDNRIAKTSSNNEIYNIQKYTRVSVKQPNDVTAR